MFKRKIKTWLLKRKLRLKREKQILTVGDLINLELDAHKAYLKAGRTQIEEIVAYKKGFRDGVKAVWKSKVK